MNNLEFAFGKIKFKISFCFLLFISVASFYSENFYIVIISILLHESGHAISLYLSGGKIYEIHLKLTDINIVSDLMKLSSLKAMFVITAGPMVNILTGILFSTIDENISITNYTLGLLQILPVVSSDMYNLVMVLLKGCFQKVLNAVCFIFSLLVFFLGLNLMIISKYNYSLLILGIFLIIKTLS